ncbi:cyclase family protein [Acetivibrio mesophilus]|uniref:Cyclase family protein n=1 Tax=Acetivibrio mesophilus TaxID=2487273 RepID=A0A4Q0I777_9FIRM|nr:cyclase family protein [Acetivibrio mesophilus]ODM25185.1 cyclase [Clostridium sp. Bc-iso-3]RXE59797.1 cyclase family protein [Acetivibrio mesophilus]HHV29281.1 cyclase family protein [Clostridium sp.]
MKLIDLTHKIEDYLPAYPGDKETRLINSKKPKEDGYTNHRLQIDMHSGTHIDSPMHLTDSKEYICDYPLESFIGEGCIIDVRNEPIIKLKKEYKDIITEGCILLLYTGLHHKFGTKEYFNEHPVVDMEFAEFMTERKIKILGMDTPSPDKPPFSVHRLLLKSKIFILENLTNMEALLDAQKFEVIALPLNIKADSSILRVVARVM